MRLNFVKHSLVHYIIIIIFIFGQIFMAYIALSEGYNKIKNYINIPSQWFKLFIILFLLATFYALFQEVFKFKLCKGYPGEESKCLCSELNNYFLSNSNSILDEGNGTIRLSQDPNDNSKYFYRINLSKYYEHAHKLSEFAKKEIFMTMPADLYNRLDELNFYDDYKNAIEYINKVLLIPGKKTKLILIKNKESFMNNLLNDISEHRSSLKETKLYDFIKLHKMYFYQFEKVKLRWAFLDNNEDNSEYISYDKIIALHWNVINNTEGKVTINFKGTTNSIHYKKGRKTKIFLSNCMDEIIRHSQIYNTYKNWDQDLKKLIKLC